MISINKEISMIFFLLQLLSLAEKLATAEQNEATMKQRAEHESKMCNLLRGRPIY
jgi:hypothetical protein